MESFDYTKIIWVVAVGAYLFVQIRGRKAQQQQTSEEEGSVQPTDWERLFGEELKREEKISGQQDLESPQVEVMPRRSATDFEAPILEEEPKSKPTPKVEFDLKKAVIMSEILTPKFKDE
ncbi:MAG: hypothetical protein SNG02_04660 [Rikenellaceae bacterium]